MPLNVRPFGLADHEAWDAFVLAHPRGTPFHLTAWKASIESTFRYAPLYVLAEESGALRGVLPLFLVENFVVKKALVSTPFAVYGGILADSPEAREAIRFYVESLAHSLGAEYVELRNTDSVQCSGLPRISRYATFTAATEPDEQAVLRGLPKKTRNTVRKALKQGFALRKATGIDAFEDLHSRNLRRLGTPSFPRSHFASLLASFGKMIDIREVHYESQVVAASLNFYFRGQMHVYYAATDARYRTQCPNSFLYFELLCWAGRNGFEVFDFGRSKKGTGPFDFKRRWNTTMRELPYEVMLVARKQLPNYSPANPKFRAAIRLWKALPLPLTRSLGPRVVRLFP